VKRPIISVSTNPGQTANSDRTAFVFPTNVSGTPDDFVGMPAATTALFHN
jgi:hypothetical protein